MNVEEHLLVCLAEEGAEIAHDCSKSLRFGINDHNYLNPTGPSNKERLVEELNDLIGVVQLLVLHGLLPKNWSCRKKQSAKRKKITNNMAYARSVGALK